MCSGVHCFHSPSGIDADLGNRTSTGPTNHVGESLKSSNNPQNIRVEGLVKQTASAEVKIEHLEAEGRKLLFPSSSLVHQTLLGSEGSRVPWIAIQ